MAAAATLSAAAALTAGPAQASSAAPAAKAATLSPQVRHTGSGPTGYTVTFRYRDPSASRVQIKGEWYFSDAAHSSSTSSQGLLPTQWTKGDFPIAYPNATAANWPVLDLTRGSAGVWSLTLPLPSGTFTYGFFVNCADDTGAGCTEVADPANPPWNSAGGTSTGSVEPDSEVYVPSDPRFGTADFGWQAPVAPGRRGRLVDVSYPSPQSTSPAGTHPLAVYTPPGYDPSRKQPYPTLYLSHGGGGQEVDWSTQGAAGSILDNLIASGKVQPMVVVMTNFNGLPDGNEGYAQDVLQNVIPYVQAHYHVSADAADRAFAGLSAGGSRANTLLFDHTSAFGYYSVMSTGGGVPTTVTPAQVAALDSLSGLQVGGGLQDPIRANTLGEQQLLTGAGVPFTDDSVNGGHEWYVWRILLHDFLAGQAFKATSTSVAAGSGRGSGTVTARVAAASTGPAPTGTVRFTVDGRSTTVRLVHGAATLKVEVPRGGGHSVTAVYSGDALHSGSRATARL
ncbi:putative esterase [Actinacidiphila reveromycinica]|uniref:Putative esterase n=1 Tax=Actinacidiphila reveromycinica TaxID=659352 RepID=A0A7U3VLK1_9ACTN|nr:putative esterase [Streptomyces sp. SN-593]